ncbi:MAG: (deoxy)nucleoside triphosphate pyrophosphohydrolase [Deltaproteobacteria bacterium]|nr:MAG: (deoxy)nucleoside triphosphate pyrophosphohydrolase [Deltaproteobacteria bacterium]
MERENCQKKRVVRVVAALIRSDDGRVLVTQRKPTAFMPLRWEFPGGNVGPGESDSEALAQALHEELDVTVEVLDEFLAVLHEYPDFTVDFHVYNCNILDGQPKRMGVHDFRWVEPEQLESLSFPPADEPTVRKLVGLNDRDSGEC